MRHHDLRKRRAILSVICRVTETRGFREYHLHHFGDIFAHEWEGGIQHFFNPVIVPKGEGFQVLGSLGLNVSEFEAFWEKNIDDRMDSGRVNVPLFELFLTNVYELSGPPIFHVESRQSIESELPEWIHKIMNVVQELPRSIESTVFKLDKPVIDGFTLSSMRSNDVKYLYFLRWLERAGLLPDRIDVSAFIPRRVAPFNALLD